MTVEEENSAFELEETPDRTRPRTSCLLPEMRVEGRKIKSGQVGGATYFQHLHKTTEAQARSEMKVGEKFS